jgi:hypothetical protein
MIEYIKISLEAQVSGQIKVIEGTIEPAAIEATALPVLESPKPKKWWRPTPRWGRGERKPRKESHSPAAARGSSPS